MTYKKKANKEIVEEVNDLKLEKEEQRQAKLEAESEWAKMYEEQFRKERQLEEEEFLNNIDISEPRYPDEEFPMS
jgi:hypothetical protein